MADPTKIAWRRIADAGACFADVSPDPERYEPMGFPAPWQTRPWIFGVMVASANGVVSWRRRGPADDPMLAVLGGDAARPERVADRRLMRLLRCYGDVSVGAQTLRDEPALVQTPQEPGESPVPELYRFRTERGLPRHPRVIVYSLYGRLPAAHPVLHTEGLDVVVITTRAGAAELQRRGIVECAVIEEALPDRDALRRAHERLFVEHGVRYLACEGGEMVLRALHEAGLLDEVFMTTTDATIDTAAHEDVRTFFDFEREGAMLNAEGRIRPGSGWLFRRWRLNRRHTAGHAG